jgi:uncharacterized repeat protein (TIGR01451 family)
MQPLHTPYLPAWFRGLIVALALVVMCACQSTNRLARDGESPSHELSPPQTSFAAARPDPRIVQAQYVSQQWIDQVPSEPYHGYVPPCSCCGPQSGGPGAVGPAGYCGEKAQAGHFVGPPDEYLCDGGDYGMPAGVRADWSTTGIEQEDAISHYDTVDGRVVVEPSNRVCIYAPRFGAVRRVENLLVNQHRVGPGRIVDEMGLVVADEVLEPASSVQRHAPSASLGDQPANLFRSREQAGGIQSRIVAMHVTHVLSAQTNLHVMRLGIIDNAEKPWLAQAILSAHTWASDQSAQVVIDSKAAQQLKSTTQPGQVYVVDEPDSPRIRLIKIASKGAAQLGEEVEFALRFDNIGDQTIGNVTIIDNLSTRLELVEGSQKASVDAEFFSEPNEGGSHVLRWEIAKPLKPGEGGVITFRTRVR